MASDDLLRSLLAAVAAAPDDLALRLHLADMLATAGRRSEAVQHAAVVLQHDPENAAALAIVQGTARPAHTEGQPEDGFTDDERESLRRLEAELGDILPPPFAGAGAEPAPRDVFDVDQSVVRLDDVAGLDEVKRRLEAGFLAPIRNPDLVRVYGKSLRGGLLLYGPPGCGKTFIARAVAGEVGAHFLAVSLADVLDMYVGQSERNIREIFETGRRNAPCVIFLDEVDALGQKRSQLRNNAARGTVNQLLSEMDGIAADNEGVYVLGATNHPWDVDVALRRPGRFDRMLLVLPPDEAARQALFRYHLRTRPIEAIDVGRLAKRTEGYSGADIAFVCENAAEHALLDSARSGTVRMIGMTDLEKGIADVRPSIGPWLETARNVAQFSNQDGTYDDLVHYLRQRRMV
ncbi:MAG: AAA family ATPase [Acidimicrobiales bacterium]